MINIDKYKSIIRKHGSPVLILDSQKIIDNYEILKESLPGVEIYYAVKSNSEAEVIRILEGVGCNFDVASINEIKLCLDYGICSDRLLFTHPIKTSSDIVLINEYGLNTFVIDNIREIDKIPIGSKILIRVKTFDYKCGSNLSKKFGCEISEIEELAKNAREKGLNVIGICFHVGSQASSNQAYVDMLISLKEIYDYLEKQGFKLEILDIGGGFPSFWDSPVDMYEFCSPLRECLSIFEKYKIIAEPGRYIVNNAFTLLYSVIGKNIRDGKIWYYVDEGVYGSFSTIIYDKVSFSINFLHKGNVNLESCVLSGQTCDCVDIISEDILLPSDLEIGDLLITEYIGAYSTVCSTKFNGFSRTKVISV
ncbi:MAG TPA: type III PLP-dependent enzyme [Candidatus Paceibacterota bacterium]|nr:type III PLP-dependent enzyme [Candidatus Paceibacterota bacterium]